MTEMINCDNVLTEGQADVIKEEFATDPLEQESSVADAYLKTFEEELTIFFVL